VKTETEINRGQSQIIWIALIALAVTALAAAFFLDQPIAAGLKANTPPQLRHLMLILSRVGDWPAHVIVCMIGIVVSFARKERDWMRIFVAMLIALTLAGLTGRIIKIATGRARPSVTTEQHWNGWQLSSKYHAFPSGHTATSTAFFVTLFLARKKIAAPLLPVPILIAFSRMVVGAHYLSDVIFAAILGVVCALLTARWLSIRNPQSAIRDSNRSPITSH